MGYVTIDVRRADERFVTREAGRTTYHSFSYGAHYDPERVGVGPLIALNDEQLPPGTGYDDHAHARVEIVTWVLEGTLVHRDSLGHDLALPAGSVQYTGTGAGIRHTEAAGPDGVRFLQMMLRPDPGADERPVHIVSRVHEGEGLHRVDLPLRVAAAWYAGTIPAGGLDLPEGSLRHVHVVSGHVVAGDRELGPGDGAILHGERHRRLEVEEPSRLALWVLPV